MAIYTKNGIKTRFLLFNQKNVRFYTLVGRGGDCSPQLKSVELTVYLVKINVIRPLDPHTLTLLPFNLYPIKTAPIID